MFMSLYDNLISIEGCNDNQAKELIEKYKVMRPCFDNKENLILKNKLNGIRSIEESYQIALNAYGKGDISINDLPGTKPLSYFNMLIELAPLERKNNLTNNFNRRFGYVRADPWVYNMENSKHDISKVQYLDDVISKVMELD